MDNAQRWNKKKLASRMRGAGARGISIRRTGPGRWLATCVRRDRQVRYEGRTLRSLVLQWRAGA